MTLWVLAPLFELFEAKTVCTRQQLKYSNAPLECGGTGFEDEYEDDGGGAPVQVGGGVRLPQRYKLIGNIGAPVSPTPPSFGTFRQVIILFITIFTSMLIAHRPKLIKDIQVFIITRPKPAWRAGSRGQDTDQVGTFWGVLIVSLRASSTQLGFKPTRNKEKP